MAATGGITQSLLAGGGPVGVAPTITDRATADGHKLTRDEQAEQSTASSAVLLQRILACLMLAHDIDSSDIDSFLKSNPE